ncbi:hypothetical protein HUU59_00200 [bacterium]|nr:hypothetical protein [bacterium]
MRKIQESLRLSEQRRAERALAAQQQKLELFANEKEAQCLSMDAAIQTEFRIVDRQIDWKYLQRIDRIVGYQTGVVNEYLRHESEARRRFIEARKRSMSLEKLGEKKRDAWRSELIELEQKIADEQSRKRSGHSQ